ncbi:unnamed protein product, partial [Scytosiphon promiscuus]
MFSAGALFPLEVIKTNLQAHTKNRTTTPPTTAAEAEEEEERGEEEEEEGAPLTVAGRDGGGGEMQARRNQNQQAAAAAAPSVASVARDIHSREGLPGFYTGVWYASGQSGLDKAAYFYGY